MERKRKRRRGRLNNSCGVIPTSSSKHEGGNVTESEDCTLKAKNRAHECHVCHVVFRTQKSLENHVTQDHQSSNNSCNQMEGEGTSTVSCKNKHRKQKHGDGDNESDRSHKNDVLSEVNTGKGKSYRNEVCHSCKICGQTFARAANVKLHMRVHTGERPFACKVCGKTFARTDHLKSHEQRHSAAKNFSCDECDEAFKRADLLRYHKVNSHGAAIQWSEVKKYTKLSVSDEEKTVLCDVCGKSFNDQKRLKNHVKKHIDFQKFSCQFCGQSFNQISNLNVHLRKHTGAKPYKCATCDEAFTTSAKLKTHTRKHTGELPYTCEICGRLFGESHLLKMHKQVHSGTKSFMCSHCGKAFTHRSTLRAHVRIHTGARPYKCDVCGQAFAQISSLTYHKRTHTGEKPYSCHICGSSYTRLTTLNIHLSRHSGEKRLSCPHCSYKCDLQKVLKSHLEVVHEISKTMYEISKLNASRTSDALYADNVKKLLSKNKPADISPTMEKDKETFVNPEDNLTSLFQSAEHTSTNTNSGSSEFTSGDYVHPSDRNALVQGAGEYDAIDDGHFQSEVQPYTKPLSRVQTPAMEKVADIFTTGMEIGSLKTIPVPEPAVSSGKLCAQNSDRGHVTSTHTSTTPTAFTVHFEQQSNGIVSEQSQVCSGESPGNKFNITSAGNSDFMLQNAKVTETGKDGSENHVDDNADNFVSLVQSLSGSPSAHPTLFHTSPGNGAQASDKLTSQLPTVKENTPKLPTVEDIDLKAIGSAEFSNNASTHKEMKILTSDEEEAFLSDSQDLLSSDEMAPTAPEVGDHKKSESEVRTHSVKTRTEQRKDKRNGRLKSKQKEKQCSTKASGKSKEKEIKCSLKASANSKQGKKQYVAKASGKKQGGKPTCSVCGQVFSRRGNLTTHMRLHSGERPYRCKVCSKTFTRSDHLKAHTVLHGGEEQMACNHCMECFDSADDLRSHIVEKHSGKLPFVCGICQFSCLRLAELKDHMKNHETKDQFSCVVCQETFSKSKDLKHHMKNHPGVQAFECKPCGRVFREGSCLKLHQMTRHTGLKPFKCGVCEVGFIAAARLHKHMWKHTGQKPFTCEFCGKLFQDITLLKMHLKIHTKERPYQCQDCGQSFTHRSTLRAHKRTHTGTKPYRCEVCGDAFAQISSLTYHKRRHDGLKPYKCTICGKAYTRSTTLNVHMSRHTGLRRVPCPQCNFTCDTQRALKKHMNKVHVSQTVTPVEDIGGELQKTEEVKTVYNLTSQVDDNLPHPHVDETEQHAVSTQMQNQQPQLPQQHIQQQHVQQQHVQQQHPLHSFQPHELPSHKIMLYLPVLSVQQPVMDQRTPDVSLSEEVPVTPCQAQVSQPQLMLTVAPEALRSLISVNQVDISPQG